MTLAMAQKQNTFLQRSGPATGTPNPQAAGAAHLAHDAHNWLMVLQLYCDLLSTSGAVTGDGQKWVDELSSAVERGHALIDSLIESLLDSLLDSVQSSGPVASGSPQAVPPQPPLNLATALERRLPLLRQMAGDKIQVEIKTTAEDGPTALKEPEFERILLNLARNAIDAMPGGGTLRVMLERRRSGSRLTPREHPALVMRVSDSGSGIARELLPHIFNSGVSTKITSADHGRSRGFGLAIVRELTLGAGGSVRVRSRVGHGTSFAIELPLLELPLRSESHGETAALHKKHLAVVSEMPRSKTGVPRPKTGRRAQFDNAHFKNCDANRKGTRVTC